MHNSPWKKLAKLVTIAFVTAIQLLPVFAQTGTTVPPPPTGVPGITAPTGSPTPTAGGNEVTTSEDGEFRGTTDGGAGAGGASGGFIDTSRGQAGLDPNQYAGQYQGQFFSRITTARDAFAQVSNFMLSFLGAVAIMFIIWGGFLYITASGDQGKLDKAKKVIWGTVMSIIIVFGIYALISTLFNIGAAVNPGVGVGPLQTGPGGTTLRVPF